MKIAAIAILKDPDIEQASRNIVSYQDYVEYLIIIDNSIVPVSLRRLKLTESVTPTEYLANNRNAGESAVLNKAAGIALKNGCKWLLIMDQDTYFMERELISYLDAFRELYDCEDISVVCPDQSLKQTVKLDAIPKEVYKGRIAGSLINIDICHYLQGFDEHMFTSDVDIEYCYRSIVNGFKVIEISNILVSKNEPFKKKKQKKSEQKKTRSLLPERSSTYYLVRNHLYIESKYSRVFPQDIRNKRNQWLKSLKKDLFYSGHFFHSLTAAVKGFIDYKMNKFD